MAMNLQDMLGGGGGMPMGGGPPDSIPIPGGPPGAGGGGTPGPDTPQAKARADQIAELLQQELNDENDPEDKATISKILASWHQYQGSQQKMMDQATGAGPGAKLIRKVTPTGQ